MSFQLEMAIYTVFTRKQLEDCLRVMEEEFSPEETDFNLACRIDTSNSLKRPNMVELRQQQIAENLKMAVTPYPEDPTKRNYQVYPLDILRKLAVDLNFFPENLLKGFLWERHGIYHDTNETNGETNGESEWNILAEKVKEVEPDVDPVDVLRTEIQGKILYNLRQVETLLKMLREDGEIRAQGGVVPYDPSQRRQQLRGGKN